MSATATVHEMDEMGAQDEMGVVWLPRSRYTRTQARTWFANWTGMPWIEARIVSRFMVHAPDDPGAGEYDGEYWVECSRDHPGAFPVWRCE